MIKKIPPAPFVAKTKTSSGLLKPKAFLLATLTLYLQVGLRARVREARNQEVAFEGESRKSLRNQQCWSLKVKVREVVGQGWTLRIPTLWLDASPS